MSTTCSLVRDGRFAEGGPAATIFLATNHGDVTWLKSPKLYRSSPPHANPILKTRNRYLPGHGTSNRPRTDEFSVLEGGLRALLPRHQSLRSRRYIPSKL